MSDEIEQHEKVAGVEALLADKLQMSDAETPQEYAKLVVDEIRKPYLAHKINAITERLLQLRDDDHQHYSHVQIQSMDDVHRALPDGVDTLNWLFVGTSGIHGDYGTLDEYPERDAMTVLIVRPRTVSCLYGVVDVDDADVRWLREQCEKTGKAIHEHQLDNYSTDG